MKVLMLVPNLRVSNGVTSYAMAYYRNLDHNQVHMDFAVYKDVPTPYYDDIRKNGDQIHVLPDIKNFAKHMAFCQKIMKDNHYNVIHNNTLHIAIPLMWCAMLQHVPVRILHSHNTKMGNNPKKEHRNRLVLPVLRSLATDYVGCSDMAGTAMFGKAPFTNISNVIECDRFVYSEEIREQVRRELGVNHQYVIGSVGRVSAQKNPKFAMQVVKELAEQGADFEYWWIGTGNMDREIGDYVRELGLQERVKMLGNRTDIPRIYQALDCFFLPSLFEGLPVTGVEAQAMGLPMLVSDTVTREMQYTDLITFYSLNTSVEDWAKQLGRTMTRKVDRASYAVHLRGSRFSDANCGKLLENYYLSCLERNKK